MTEPSVAVELARWVVDRGLAGGGPLSSAEELAAEYLRDQGFRDDHARVDSLIRWEQSKTFTTGFITGIGGLVTLPVAVPAALGASWLHVVDLDGAKDGRLANRSVIIRLASQKALHIQVGGGVRSAAVVDDLLRHGIDRVIVGSAAVENPTEVQGWLKRYGAEKVGLAFDIRHDKTGVELGAVPH